MRTHHRFRGIGAAKIAALAIWTVAILGSTLAVAAAPPAPVSSTPPATHVKQDPAGTIKVVIEARYPGTHVLDVQPSPIPGVYEVFVGDAIIYSDVNADYVLMGPLVDTHTRQNLTDVRLNERGRIDFHSLPFDRAIKIVKGNGKRQFAVFSDPDCPFCLELEKSLVPINDVTMYVFLFPIASLHPQAPAKAHAIWCAKDRAQAWTQWMREKKLPPAGPCSGDPIDELQRLGDQLHISATPTIFFTDGRKVAGAIPIEQIEQHLAAASSGSSPRP